MRAYHGPGSLPASRFESCTAWPLEAPGGRKGGKEGGRER